MKGILYNVCIPGNLTGISWLDYILKAVLAISSFIFCIFVGGKQREMLDGVGCLMEVRYKP